MRRITATVVLALLFCGDAFGFRVPTQRLSVATRSRINRICISSSSRLSCAAEAAGGGSAALIYEQQQHQQHVGFSKFKAQVLSVFRFVLPIALQVLAIMAIGALFGALPAHAKSKVKKAAALAAAATGGADAVDVPRKKPKVSFLRKLLQGANVEGGLKNWQAGDTRSEFAALLNSFSSIIILGAMSFVAYIKHKHREIGQDRALRKELNKVNQYSCAFSKWIHMHALKLASQSLPSTPLFYTYTRTKHKHEHTTGE